MSRPEIGLHKKREKMTKKRKVILGKIQKKNKRKRKLYFTEEEKHIIIRDLLSSKRTKREIWEKYTGRTEEHGQILRWMRSMGYEAVDKPKRSNFVSKTIDMKKNRKGEPELESIEYLQLIKRVEELEKQLEEAEMRAIAYSTMVDIAEQEYKIPIRKKLNTKPSKR